MNELPINQILCGDAIELMKTLPDGSIDVIITDPPYFNQGTKPKYTRKGRKDVVTEFGEWDVFKSDEDYLSFIKPAITEMCRVLKENGSFWCFTNDRYVSYLRHHIKNTDGMTYATTVVWHKYNSPPRFIMKAGFISSKELIMFAYKGKNPTFHKPKEFKEFLDVWITPQTPSGERTGHPTQKPVSLIEKMIRTSSNEGDLILDPFVGSGTTCFAARRLNRHYIGFDNNAEYVEIAKHRMATIPKPLEAFE